MVSQLKTEIALTALDVREANRQEIAPLLVEEHYITKNTRRFRSTLSVGAFYGGVCHAACAFAQPSSPEAIQGAFGLPKGQFDGIFELTRFCVSEQLRAQTKNAGSWFMSRAIRLLRKNKPVRALITYADASIHDGGLYRASNFIYCGLTSLKRDYWFLQPDGTYTKHGRGAVTNREGEWRIRTRKHRYAMVFDKKLPLNWPRVKFVPLEISVASNDARP